MPTTKFEFTGKSDPLEAAYLNDCRLLSLEPEEQTSLKVRGQGLLFVLNGSGEMRTTYEQKQRRSTLEKQQLFSLQPGTEVSLQGGRISFSLLFVDFAIYRCLRVDLEHFEYSAVSLSLPFCMHIQPLDRRDTLLQRMAEELTVKNFGYITAIQSLLVELADLWQTSAQKVFSSFWSTIDSIWISGCFPESGQTLSLSDMTMVHGTPESPLAPLGFFPADQCRPLLYCRERVTPLPALYAGLRSFRIQGAFTLVTPILESQNPLDLSQFQRNSYLQVDFVTSAPCVLDISLYSQTIQKGTLYHLHCDKPDTPLHASITTGDDHSRFSLSWHVHSARSYILQHFRERLRLEQIADALHINPHYLSTIFHEQMGTTLSAYIQTLRLEEAARLLVQTDRTMKEIAQELGFCDIQHFSKTFQKKYDMRPLAYRQVCRIRVAEMERKSPETENKAKESNGTPL